MVKGSFLVQRVETHPVSTLFSAAIRVPRTSVYSHIATRFKDPPSLMLIFARHYLNSLKRCCRSVSRMAYSVEERGSPYTADYRVFVSKLKPAKRLVANVAARCDVSSRVRALHKLILCTCITTLPPLFF